METKNKYTRAEVLEILGEREAKFNEELAYEKGVAAELKDELKRVNAELETYKNRDNLIGATLRSAEEKAEEIRRTAELKYATELERLNLFKEKWSAYFGYLAETYPYYSATEDSRRIMEALDRALGKNDGTENKLGELEELLKNVHVAFDPKSKIEEYIAATENSAEDGFDLEAVLNPGELDLEDLCRELGLMEKE